MNVILFFLNTDIQELYVKRISLNNQLEMTAFVNIVGFPFLNLTTDDVAEMVQN